MIVILHNPACSKSNCSLELLQKIHEPFEIRNYLENPLNMDELNALLKLLALDPIDIVRKKEPLYLSLFASKELNKEQLLKMIAENPILLERPIIIKNDKAIIGRPLEKVAEFLAS